jgi:hypothetical protein
MEEETWNMASATLKRFDLILKQSSFMAQTGNLTGWFKVLMDLRRNIYPFVPEKEWGEIQEKFESLPKDWRLSNGTIHPTHFATVSRILDEVYMAFLKVMKSKGLLMPKSIDTSKAVLDM